MGFSHWFPNAAPFYMYDIYAFEALYKIKYLPFLVKNASIQKLPLYTAREKNLYGQRILTAQTQTSRNFRATIYGRPGT